MSRQGFTLRHLAFTGKGKPDAVLAFADGLNVVYGASNTGKSFAVKALSFMLGGKDPLPAIEQRRGYSHVWLGLTIPDGRDVTLYRAARGGGFLIYEGLVQEPTYRAGVALGQRHAAQSGASLSGELLKSLGIEDKEIVKNADGQKESLGLRGLVPFLLVQENAIFDERSPLMSGQIFRQTAEKNIFRFLLTGRDDAAVVPYVGVKILGAMQRGKVELVDELVTGIEAELENVPAEDELIGQSQVLESSLVLLEADLRSRQAEIDTLVKRRRDVADCCGDLANRIQELDVTLARFAKLDEVYQSDLGRLTALEEGSFLLRVRTGRPCPLCGAAPEHGIHTHDEQDLDRAHSAAQAEMRKIHAEARDLRQTVSSLQAEAEGLRRRLAEYEAEKASVSKDIEHLRPQEGEIRGKYEELLAALARVKRSLDLIRQRDSLRARRVELDVPVRRRSKSDALAVGVDGEIAHAFASTVQAILREWHFPGEPIVSFDLELQDIRLDGKERSANGKGVRALLHAAFKIGVLVFCRNHQLPHPGFIVLDTPLLAYREPLKNPKHGELLLDEMAIKKTALDEYFYRFLGSMADKGQVVVLENSDPPSSVSEIGKIQAFTGRVDLGRFGFFPPDSTSSEPSTSASLSPGRQAIA
jgi:predicted nuclease with TOPRIM domain